MRMVFADSRNNLKGGYCCEWDTEEDFTRHIIEDCYDIERMIGSFANYFDYETYAC